MTTEFLTYLVLGAAFGGFINGLAGTGTALFALGFFLVVLDPMRAVALVALLSIVVGVQGLWLVRHSILAQPKRLLRFMLPGLLGVPVGLGLLQLFDPSALRIMVALTLIFYGGYFGFRAHLPAFERATPRLDSAIGFLGGILGGMAALAGVLPQIWLSLRPWSKSETRAVLQPFNFSVLSTTVISLALMGAFDAQTVWAAMIALPVGLVAAQIGITVFRRLSDTRFRRLLILLTLLMGLGVLVSEVT